MFSISYQDLDKALALLDKDIRVIRYGYPQIKYHGNCDALSYKGEHVGSIPHGTVYDHRNPNYYVMVFGKKIIHRDLNGILRMIGQLIPPYKLKRFKQFIRTKDFNYLKGEKTV